MIRSSIVQESTGGYYSSGYNHSIGVMLKKELIRIQTEENGEIKDVKITSCGNDTKLITALILYEVKDND